MGKGGAGALTQKSKSSGIVMSRLSIEKLALKAGQKERYVYDLEESRLALRLRRNASGTYLFAWVYLYMLHGVRKKAYLGTYPKVSIRDAREKARGMAAEIAHGGDPVQRMYEQAEHSAPQTFGDLYERWFEEVIVKKRPKSHGHVAQIFRDHIFFSPNLKSVQLSNLKPHYIQPIVDRVQAKGKQRTLSMVLQLLKQLFTWAQDFEFMDRNPARIFKEGDFCTPVSRDRYLQRDEIVQLMRGLQKAQISPQFVSALMLILATGNRSTETRLIKVKDINLEARRITIPVSNQKQVKGVQKKPHVVYLSDFALKHVKKLLELSKGSEYLLPHLRYSDQRLQKPISKSTLLHQLTRHDGVSAHSKTDLLKLSGGRFTVHDLRRTASSHMQEMRVDFDVIDKCQNHEIEGKVRRTYMRGQLESLMKDAWQKLGRFLEELELEALPKLAYAA